MTDQGRGYGSQDSQPWHPGDPGYAGQQQSHYAQQQWPQQGYPQQQGWSQQNAYGEQGYSQQPQPYQQTVPQQEQYQQYPPQQPQYVEQHTGQWQQPQYASQQPRPVQQQPVQQQVQAAPIPQPAGPGPDGIDWEAEAAALEAEAAGLEAEQLVEADEEHWTEEDPEAGYLEGEDEEQESFFGGEEDNSREAERKRKEKGKKAGRRNGGACLLVALVLLGGVGGAGWWGYGFYQSHFGPPPDFQGEGTGTVNVEIKPGSGDLMGQVLKEADVVKSVKAFTNAYSKNPKAFGIQPGAYTLHHEMSATAAVQLLIDSAGGNSLIIPEGKKTSDIYAAIDKKLKLNAGTTANVAKAQAGNLGLPDYAKGNPEGFLFPTRYSITEGMKPEDLLKQMVSNAVSHYQQLNLDAGAKNIGLQNAYQVITEASILQAEGNNPADFGRIARVLSNRLNTNATQGKLQLDTTLQYELGRNNFSIAEKDDPKLPYNTYTNKGLPPTPISNPGDDAIQAVLNPTPGNWVYFVAVSYTDTRFADTFDNFKKDVKDYCTAHNQGFDEAAGMCK